MLAHEVGHLRAGDLAVMGVSDAISRLAQGLALIGLISVPFALTRRRVRATSDSCWSPWAALWGYPSS